MIPIEFKYSDGAHYPPAGAFNVKSIDIINQDIIVTSDNQSFHASFPNVFEKYKLPYVKSDAIVQRWHSNWMSFWQNQLNFAISCASTACGVDFSNHLTGTDLIGSLFRFHVYYQTRRILKEMNAAMPQDPSWNAFDNSYDRSAYERICKEFGVDTNADWRQKQDDNQGLGRIYQWNKGWKPYDWKKEAWIGDEYMSFDWGVAYDSSKFTFTGKTTNEIIHIDFIAQVFLYYPYLSLL